EQGWFERGLRQPVDTSRGQLVALLGRHHVEAVVDGAQRHLLRLGIQCHWGRSVFNCSSVRPAQNSRHEGQAAGSSAWGAWRSTSDMTNRTLSGPVGRSSTSTVYQTRIRRE